MLANWKAEIARIAHWKQLASQYDKLKALPFHLPKLGAAQDQILQAEAALDSHFSAEYKEFLTLADGWRGFYISVDLFGTADFIAGRADIVRRRPEIKQYIQANGWRKEDVVPIGASDVELDVFLLIAPTSSNLSNGVVWWANEEVDRYSTYHDFLAAMVNYNAQIATKLAQR